MDKDTYMHLFQFTVCILCLAWSSIFSSFIMNPPVQFISIKKNTMFIMSSSPRQEVEIDQPTLQMTSLDNSLSGHHRNCFIFVLSTPEDATMITKMEQVPSMVLYMGKQDHFNLIHSPGLLFEYSPGSPVITVTCQGFVRRGVLFALSHSLGPVDDMCSMKNKEIRIAFNKAPPMFDVNEGKVESATLEGAVLDIFLEKNNLRPTFIHAKQIWGKQDETSGLWDGVIGLVRVAL